MAVRVWVNACRFLLGGVFVFSGFVKAVDPLGSLYKIGDYLAAFGMGGWFAETVLLLAAIALAVLEFTVGVYLLLGIRRSSAASLALAFLAVMTPLTLYLAIVNPVHDCGCFGDAWVLTNWQTFGKNVVLLVAAVSVFRGRKLLVRFITARMAWLMSLYTMLFAAALSVYCLENLPILDFRPYKVGTDLQKATTLPAEGGEIPPINDFWLTEVETGEDLTDSVLGNAGYTFLLVAHRIEQADDSHTDLINEVYDYSVEYGYAFLALTASGDEAIEEWRDRTGAEYPFCRVDDVALKTVIRSNPGLLLLQGGRILGKWSDNRLPDEYSLTDRLERLPIGRVQAVDYRTTLGYVLLWFAVPLVCIVVLDLLLKRRDKKYKRSDI